jgi:hypothetical protein
MKIKDDIIEVIGQEYLACDEKIKASLTFEEYLIFRIKDFEDGMTLN